MNGHFMKLTKHPAQKRVLSTPPKSLVVLC